jgi:hypothetical protein
MFFVLTKFIYKFAQSRAAIAIKARCPEKGIIYPIPDTPQNGTKELEF